MVKVLFVSGYDDETIQHYRINQCVILQQSYRQSKLVEKGGRGVGCCMSGFASFEHDGLIQTKSTGLAKKTARLCV